MTTSRAKSGMIKRMKNLIAIHRLTLGLNEVIKEMNENNGFDSHPIVMGTYELGTIPETLGFAQFYANHYNKKLSEVHYTLTSAIMGNYIEEVPQEGKKNTCARVGGDFGTRLIDTTFGLPTGLWIAIFKEAGPLLGFVIGLISNQLVHFIIQLFWYLAGLIHR